MTHRSTRSARLQRTGRSHLALLLVATLLAWPSGCQSMHLATRAFDTQPDRQELVLGIKAYQAILDTHPRSQNAHLTQMLERVGQRLAAVSERPDYAWEFKLLSGPHQNAFCFPGGKVGVFEGILPACQNEAGLAVVTMNAGAPPLEVSAVRAALKEALANYKVPKMIVVAEALPRNAMGKVQKNLLRSTYRAQWDAEMKAAP